MEKLFIKHYNEVCPVYFELNQYANNDNLAVIMLTDDVIVDEPFHYCTVNLGMRLQTVVFPPPDGPTSATVLP